MLKNTINVDNNMENTKKKKKKSHIVLKVVILIIIIVNVFSVDIYAAICASWYKYECIRSWEWYQELDDEAKAKNSDVIDVEHIVWVTPRQLRICCDITGEPTIKNRNRLLRNYGIDKDEIDNTDFKWKLKMYEKFGPYGNNGEDTTIRWGRWGLYLKDTKTKSYDIEVAVIGNTPREITMADRETITSDTSHKVGGFADQT